MSKITFRADDTLVDRLEEFEASKSEVMREALRAYLDGDVSDSISAESSGAEESLDELITDRIDTVLADRLDDVFQPQPQDVNVNISLEEGTARSQHVTERSDDESRVTVTDREGDSRTCSQCGEEVSGEHVYCPNCGGKTSHRIFCECGDELRSDWAFCPSCGRRTPAADVLDQ